MHLLQKFIKLSLFEAQNDTKPLLKINHSVTSKGRSAPFSEQTLELISSIPDTDLSALSNRKGFIKWLANAVEGAQRPPTREQIRLVVDFINGTETDINSLSSFDDALRASQEWHQELANKQDDSIEHRDDVNVIHDFGNGFKLVELQQCDLDDEGRAMGHCVGDYNLSTGKRILSLRDARNKPHVTIEVEDNCIEQIKGKQNEVPVEKYAKMIKEWLKTSGLKYKTCEDFILMLNTDELIEFSNSTIPERRTDAAWSPKTTEEILVKLSDDKVGNIRATVAANSNTPKEILVKLSNDKDPGVRQNICLRADTPKEILIKLSDDKNISVRWAVAKNLNTPKEILVKLSDDKEPRVRSGLVNNKNTPEEILIKLAHDEDEGIRHLVMWKGL